MTKKQLLDEQMALRERIRELEASEAESRHSLELYRSGERRFLLMADSLPVLISYVDSGQRYRFNNKAYEDWFNVSREGITGKHVREILGEESYKKSLGYIERALAGETITFERLLSYRGREDRHVQVSYVPNFGDQGKVEGFFVLAQDITQRVRVEESLKRYARGFAEQEENQKRKLARELHDQVGQGLSTIGMNLNMIRTRLPEHSSEVTAILADSFALLEQTAECIRDVMTELRPAILDDYGLATALHWYGELFSGRMGVAVELDCEDFAPRLPHEIEITLFRIAQEALNNAAKHAAASRVRIILENLKESISLTIADNGKGFDLKSVTESGKRSSFGILIMTERAQTIGGRFRIESLPGKGTDVVIEVAK